MAKLKTYINQAVKEFEQEHDFYTVVSENLNEESDELTIVYYDNYHEETIEIAFIAFDMSEDDPEDKRVYVELQNVTRNNSDIGGYNYDKEAK